MWATEPFDSGKWSRREWLNWAARGIVIGVLAIIAMILTAYFAEKVPQWMAKANAETPPHSEAFATLEAFNDIAAENYAWIITVAGLTLFVWYRMSKRKLANELQASRTTIHATMAKESEEAHAKEAAVQQARLSEALTENDRLRSLVDTEEALRRTVARAVSKTRAPTIELQAVHAFLRDAITEAKLLAERKEQLTQKRLHKWIEKTAALGHEALHGDRAGALDGVLAAYSSYKPHDRLGNAVHALESVRVDTTDADIRSPLELNSIRWHKLAVVTNADEDAAKAPASHSRALSVFAMYPHIEASPDATHFSIELKVFNGNPVPVQLRESPGHVQFLHYGDSQVIRLVRIELAPATIPQFGEARIVIQVALAGEIAPTLRNDIESGTLKSILFQDIYLEVLHDGRSDRLALPDGVAISKTSAFTWHSSRILSLRMV